MKILEALEAETRDESVWCSAAENQNHLGSISAQPQKWGTKYLGKGRGEGSLTTACQLLGMFGDVAITTAAHGYMGERGSSGEGGWPWRRRHVGAGGGRGGGGGW